jgi:chromosome segregation ATPase
MNGPDRIDQALHRLATALDQLEAAAMRRAQVDAARANLEDELSVMQDDRARLALELDGALARARTLANANNEVAKRLERTSDTIKAVIGAVERGPEPPEAM